MFIPQSIGHVSQQYNTIDKLIDLYYSIMPCILNDMSVNYVIQSTP
jgi:hypothetical protein